MDIRNSLIKKLISKVSLANNGSFREDISHSLKVIADNLDSLLKEADPQFLGICNGSQELYTSIENLRTDITESAKLIDLEGDDSPFNQVETLAQSTLEDFKNTGITIRNAVNNISALKEKLESLASQTENFRDSSSYLRIIRTNISMESVRTTRSREMFSALSDEIQALSNQINDISINMSKDLDNAQSNQHDAETGIYKGLERIDKLHSLAETKINSATSEARDMVDISAMWLVGISNAFENISRCISQVIISMQFHDIFRQQLEHTIESAAKTFSKLNESENNRELLGFTFKITKLQKAQVEHVSNDVKTASDNIKGAFNEISMELKQLNMNAINNKSSGSPDNKNAFTKLIDELSEFNTYITDASDLSRQTTQTIDMVKKTTTALADYIKEIRRISRELSFKALNAIVLTERLGQDGKTLAVLTEEVYRCAGRSQELGDQVTSILGEITELSQKISEESTSEKLEMDVTRLNDAIALMDNNYMTFNGSTNSTQRQVDNISRDAQNLMNSLGFIDNIINGLDREHDRIEHCLEILQPYAKYTNPELDKELEELSHSYTMEQERQIHNESLSATNKVQEMHEAEETPVMAAASTDDGFDDNIELF